MDFWAVWFFLRLSLKKTKRGFAHHTVDGKVYWLLIISLLIYDNIFDLSIQMIFLEMSSIHVFICVKSISWNNSKCCLGGRSEYSVSFGNWHKVPNYSSIQSVLSSDASIPFPPQSGTKFLPFLFMTCKGGNFQGPQETSPGIHPGPQSRAKYFLLF